MQINYNVFDEKPFDEIDSGECFIFGGEVYMKFQKSWSTGNAVCLNDGMPTTFAVETNVQSVFASLTVGTWE